MNNFENKKVCVDITNMKYCMTATNDCVKLGDLVGGVAAIGTNQNFICMTLETENFAKKCHD
jgi:hypothetical protein